MSDLKTGSVQGAKGGLRTGTLDRDPQQQAARDYERAQQQAAREWSKADPREQLDMVYDAAREVMQAELNRLNFQGAKGRWPFFSVNRDPVETSKTVQTQQRQPQVVLGFTVSRLSDPEVIKLVVSESVISLGAGHPNVVPTIGDDPLTEGPELTAATDKWIGIRVQLTPDSMISSDGETYIVRDGSGTLVGEVTIDAYSTAQMEEEYQLATVDPETGAAVDDGVFIIVIARVNGDGQVVNDGYWKGPMGASLCGSGGLNIIAPAILVGTF